MCNKEPCDHSQKCAGKYLPSLIRMFRLCYLKKCGCHDDSLIIFQLKAPLFVPGFNPLLDSKSFPSLWNPPESSVVVSLPIFLPGCIIAPPSCPRCRFPPSDTKTTATSVSRAVYSILNAETLWNIVAGWKTVVRVKLPQNKHKGGLNQHKLVQPLVFGPGKLRRVCSVVKGPPCLQEPPESVPLDQKVKVEQVT